MLVMTLLVWVLAKWLFRMYLYLHSTYLTLALARSVRAHEGGRWWRICLLPNQYAMLDAAAQASSTLCAFACARSMALHAML